MISVLGAKRLIFLLCLLIINVALAMFVYSYILPEAQVKKRTLNAVRGEVSALRSDIDRMQLDFDQLEEQKDEFEGLTADGFFKDQDRRQAEKILSEIQKSSGVSKARARIQAGMFEDSEEAKKARHRILKSVIEVELEAIDDINIFQYLFLLENYFPGHVTIQNVMLERSADVTGTVLRGIASGANPSLVKAKVSMVWSTMIPESRAEGRAQ